MQQHHLLNHMLSNISITIKLNLYCRHSAGWSEHKTKSNYTLWCIHKGSLCLEINNRLLTAHTGDVILFYPGDTYRAYSNVDCHFLVFFFSLETGHSIDLLATHNLAGIYHSSDITHLCHTFCEKYLTNISQYEGVSTNSFLLYADTFSFLAQLLEHTCDSIPFYQSLQNTPDFLLQQITEYMHEHFNEDITIKDLAKLADMSEKYFIHHFHFHMGISPKQYLIELRMKHALELLSQTNMSVAEIADSLGYADSYSFSKAFHKFYGESPSSFRKHTIAKNS